MSNYEKFEQNSSFYCKELANAGYTPHSLVTDAVKEGLSVWDYIAILFNF